MRDAVVNAELGRPRIPRTTVGRLDGGSLRIEAIVVRFFGPTPPILGLQAQRLHGCERNVVVGYTPRTSREERVSYLTIAALSSPLEAKGVIAVPFFSQQLAPYSL